MSVSLAALAAIGSAVASGAGAVGSAIANKKAQEYLAEQNAADNAEYDRLLNREYMERSENQALLRRLQDLQKENYQRARATNAVAGGTNASLAAQQEAGDRIVTQTAQGIAANSTAAKDRVREAKQATNRAYSQQMFGLKMQKAQNIANAAGQATGAFAGIAAAGGSMENPYEVGNVPTETVAAPAAASQAPATQPSPQLQQVIADTDLDKAVATIPSALNGWKAQYTPEQYDAMMQSKKNAQDVFALMNR